MSKTNKHYFSIFKYLKKKSSLIKKLNDRIGFRTEAHLIIHGSRRRREQLLGGLHPAARIAKGFIDTFKPYKSSYYVRRDFLQPIRGLGNIARGIGYLLAAPLIFLYSLFLQPPIYAIKIRSFWPIPYAFKSIPRYLVRTASWLLDGVLSIPRGIMQIAATPLTWFIKMPIRAIITAIKGKPLIEESRSIKKLVAEANNQLQGSDNNKVPWEIMCLIAELNHKYIKRRERKQGSNIEKASEKRAYNDILENRIPAEAQAKLAAYFGLFSNSQANQSTSLNDSAQPVSVNTQLLGSQ